MVYNKEDESGKVSWKVMSLLLDSQDGLVKSDIIQ